MAGAGLPGPRHVHYLVHAEHHRAENAADRHGEARRGVLGLWRIEWEAAVPDGASAGRARGEAMDGERGQRARADEERENNESVVGAAANESVVGAAAFADR